MKFKFSIIIPHKNTPDLLQRCLDSISNRQDIQIIVVDDNSDKDVVDFYKFPGTDDPNVTTIFSKEGKGAGYARNIGLNKAKGKWLIFADADDFFSDNILSSLDLFLESDADVIYFAPTSCVLETGQLSNRHIKLQNLVQDFIERKPGSEKRLRYTWYVPYSKMIKRKFIEQHKLRYEEVMVANDVMFSIQAGHYASKIDACLRVIYSITERENSLSRRFTRKHASIALEGTYRLNDFFDEKGIKQRKSGNYLLTLYSSQLGDLWLIKNMMISIYNRTPLKNEKNRLQSVIILLNTIKNLLFNRMRIVLKKYVYN